MYLVYPKGYEERTAAIIAEDEADARHKAELNPSIKEAMAFYGVEVVVRDLTRVFSDQGYEIFIQRKGTHH
jgi:hypothetical protein